MHELVLTKPQPSADGTLTASGRYHLVRGAYAVDVRSENLELLGLTLSDRREFRGDLHVRPVGPGRSSTQAAPWHSHFRIFGWIITHSAG